MVSGAAGTLKRGPMFWSLDRHRDKAHSLGQPQARSALPVALLQQYKHGLCRASTFPSEQWEHGN